MPSSPVRIGLVQSATSPAKADNVACAIQGIREAAAQGARLVCLQELFASPYFCQAEQPDAFDLAEPLDGPTVTAIAEVAKEVGACVAVPVFEKRAPGLYHNSMVILGRGGEQLGVYRKMHIPDDPSYHEKFYFAPGDLGFQSIPTPELKLGPLICWDQWYPEAARLTALKGAEVLLYPTAIGWLPEEKDSEGQRQLEAWRTVQRGHAIANGVFVIAVNRVGFEPGPGGGIEFWGHSFVCDPFGQIIVEAGTEPTVLVADLDLAQQEQTRRWWPFLRDRRIDAYADIVRRFGDR